MALATISVLGIDLGKNVCGVCGLDASGAVVMRRKMRRETLVRPYVKAQKNDDRDAEGIAEVATRPTMRFVDLKSQDQLDMQTLHRSRDRLVGERTALINQLRAILPRRLLRTAPIFKQIKANSGIPSTIQFTRRPL